MLAVSLIAIVLAWPNNESILSIVSFAWAGFGASFGPIILLSLYWRKLTTKGALWGMITGAVTVMIWGNIDVLKDNLYEIIPGFLLCLAVAVVVSNATYKKNNEIDKEFDAALKILGEDK